MLLEPKIKGSCNFWTIFFSSVLSLKETCSILELQKSATPFFHSKLSFTKDILLSFWSQINGNWNILNKTQIELRLLSSKQVQSTYTFQKNEQEDQRVHVESTFFWHIRVTHGKVNLETDLRRLIIISSHLNECQEWVSKENFWLGPSQIYELEWLIVGSLETKQGLFFYEDIY